MRVRKKTVAALAVTISAIVAVTGLAGAGSATTGQGQFVAGVVSDVGRFNDKSFNALALQGCKSGAKKAGGTCRAFESRSTADYIPNLVKLQREGADISITVGFLLADGTATIAKRFPKSKFAIVDYSVHAPPLANKKGNPLFKNVVGLTFATNENSYMIGCLSALMARKDGSKVVSAVGGISLPTVTIFIAAYRAGASKCVPGTRTLIDFSQDFGDQAKCKELALNQIDRGSKVVFQVAGGCGLGALDAAKERGVWGLGVDKDQSFLGPHILTSAVKRVDRAVESVILAADVGLYPAGTDFNFNLQNNGVAIGKISPKVPKAFITKMNAIGAQILAGKIKPPTTL